MKTKPLNQGCMWPAGAIKTGFLTLSLAACATQPMQPVPAQLEPVRGESLAMVVGAKGVQIYECRAKKDVGAGYEWAFVAPDAELLDAGGRTIGLHGAGPFWQAADGSKVVGKVKARADAPVAGTIPWLLLATEPAGPKGAFSTVTSIQRVNTTGGAAPATPCTQETSGQTARIQYTADYRLFSMNSQR